MNDFAEMTQAEALEALAETYGAKKAARAIAASIACGGQRVAIDGCRESSAYLCETEADCEVNRVTGELTFCGDLDGAMWCVRLERMSEHD